MGKFPTYAMNPIERETKRIKLNLFSLSASRFQSPPISPSKASLFL